MTFSHPHVDDFVARLRQAAGANLVSVVLYGSAARDDFNEKYSDLNLLCLAKDLGGAELAKIAPVVHWWSHDLRQRPPLFMTEAELRASADVFAIEMLDLKASHRVLYGADPAADLQISMERHRVQLEHELRTALLKLRQHYLLAAGDEDELRRVLVRSVSSIATLLRHSLVAAGQEPSAARREDLARAAAAFGVDATPLQAALDLREDRHLDSGVSAIYRGYLNAVAAVAAKIDALGAG